MTDDRLDLTPLALEPERRVTLVAGIVARGGPIVARHAPRGPAAVLAAWVRPALAAAAVVAVIALGMLAASRTESEAAAGPTTAEALGFPGPLAAWVETGRTPSLEEMVVSLEEARR